MQSGRKQRVVLGDAGDPRFAERSFPLMGKDRVAQDERPFDERARVEVDRYGDLDRTRRTIEYHAYCGRLDQIRDAELRRGGSKGSSWEAKITDKLIPEYSRLKSLYREATGLPPG